MSQAKVDHYKEQKKNRKKILHKEKRMHILGSVAGIVICAAAVCWAGWSIYYAYQNNKPASYNEVNMDAITGYFSEES